MTNSYSIFDETMADMKWPEVERAVHDGAIVLLPVGTIEEHGPHLPLGVDTYGAFINAKLARRELEARGIRTLVAPPFYWGINNATGSFAGSFTVRKETMKAVLWDIFASLHRWGLSSIFVINHHGDTYHGTAILEAVKEARVDTGVRACFVLDEGSARTLKLTGLEAYLLIPSARAIYDGSAGQQSPPQFLDIHAGAGETSMMLAYFPELVDAELAEKLEPTNLDFNGVLEWRRGWADGRRMTPLGYFGAPAEADAERGRRSTENNIKALVDAIEKFVKGEYKPSRLQ